MSYAFHPVTITDRRNDESFTNSPWCKSPKEAIELARLTFTNPNLWDVTCISSSSNEAAKMQVVTNPPNFANADAKAPAQLSLL